MKKKKHCRKKMGEKETVKNKGNEIKKNPENKNDLGKNVITFTSFITELFR